MRVEELLEAAISPNQLSSITWYHGGGDFDRFDMNSIGRGENNHLLGRGIYFINDYKTARFFTKYAKSKDSYVYEVRLNFTGVVYNVRERMDDRTRDAFQRLAEHLGLTNYDELYDIPGQSSMKHGMGLVGGVYKLAGMQAFDLLSKFGIQAHYEKVAPNEYEIAVFDPSVINITNKEYVSRES